MRCGHSLLPLMCRWVVVTVCLCGCGSSGPELTAPPALSSSPVAVDAEVEKSATAKELSTLCQRVLPGREIQGVVLIFALPDCPIANSYAPEYSRLDAEYAPRGWPVIVAYPDPDLTDKKMRAHVRDFKITAAVLLDDNQAWAQRVGATKTPEAVVLQRDGTVLYRGRIDDRFPANDRSRTGSRVQDLQLALESVLNGKPVAEPWPEAVGCHIPEGRDSK